VQINLKIFFFFVLSTNVVFAQIVPSFQGVYDKKSTSFSTSSSLIFDGSNDKITTNGTLASLSGFTLELWLYPHSASGSMAIIGENNLIEFGYGSATSLRIWTNSGGNKSWSFNSTTFPFNTWHHVAVVGDATASPYLRIYVNGDLKAYGGSNPGSTFGVGHTPTSYTIYLAKTVWGTGDNYYDGLMDEVRIWNDLRTQDEIKANMFKHLNGDENNLQAYYKMSTATGTTLVDNSSNSNDGTITGATWGTTYVPLGDLNSSYQTDMEGLWEATGTSASQASSGLTMTVSQTLSEENFAVFGNNNTSSTSTSDLPSGTAIRSARIWQVDKSGTVSASVIIDISEATGNSPTVGDASNYKLLHRIGTSGNFTIVATGGSVSGDNITFSGVTVNKGFYVIAATDSSNL
jgi:hypothetical protein